MSQIPSVQLLVEVVLPKMCNCYAIQEDGVNIGEQP